MKSILFLLVFLAGCATTSTLKKECVDLTPEALEQQNIQLKQTVEIREAIAAKQGGIEKILKQKTGNISTITINDVVLVSEHAAVIYMSVTQNSNSAGELYFVFYYDDEEWEVLSMFAHGDIRNQLLANVMEE